MSCCSKHPKKCCTKKYSEPTVPDECRCGRGGNNGIVQVLLSQAFLFAGLGFSMATVGDCGLIIVDEPIEVRQDGVVATALGILSYRDPETNQCYFWGDDSVVGEIQVGNETITGEISGGKQLEYYLTEVLGEDWFLAMGLLGTAVALSLCVFSYATSYYCSTQVKPCRIFTGVIAGVFLPLLQAVGTTFAHTNEWCDLEGCSMGRDTIFSICATCCFVGAGICFWTMQHWPGQTTLDDMEKKRTWYDPYYQSHRRSSRKSSSSNRNNSRKSRSSKKNPPREIEVEESDETMHRDLEEGSESEERVEHEPAQSDPVTPAHKYKKKKRSPKAKPVPAINLKPNSVTMVGSLADSKTDYIHEGSDSFLGETDDDLGASRGNSSQGKNRKKHRSKSPHHNRRKRDSRKSKGKSPSGMMIDATQTTVDVHDGFD